jgi:S1-C subfamily serine protease
MAVRPITPEEKQKLSVDDGAVVSEVKPYGEASNRGIGQNLVILEADRKEVRTPSDLKKIIDARKPGDSILMRLKAQDGSTRYVAVKLPKE